MSLFYLGFMLSASATSSTLTGFSRLHKCLKRPISKPRATLCITHPLAIMFPRNLENSAFSILLTLESWNCDKTYNILVIITLMTFTDGIFVLDWKSAIWTSIRRDIIYYKYFNWHTLWSSILQFITIKKKRRKLTLQINETLSQTESNVNDVFINEKWHYKKVTEKFQINTRPLLREVFPFHYI